MRYRILAEDNDYSFGNGQLDFYNNVPAAVGQAVETALLLWLGEWYLDTTVGTPYVQGVLGKTSQDVADGTIQTVVLNIQGVDDISNYQSSIDPNTRAMTIQMTINTVYGPTEVDIQNFRLF